MAYNASTHTHLSAGETVANERTLDDVVRDCWHRLQQGARDPASPFRYPVVATHGIAQAGAAIPAARVVVLRDVDPLYRELTFHTDQRSMKAAEIDAVPRVTLVFHDAAARVQLRVVAHAVIHADDAIADDAWAASGPSSRHIYRAKRGPGATIDAPFAWDESAGDERPRDESAGDEDSPDDTNGDAGREHFAVIRCKALSLDWLELCTPTHRRAVFQAAGDRFLGRWVVP
jgi:hypothetical protein